MKIRKLHIQGFKSFADRAVFQFDTAVSGVVGPNGCGKSNVVDAIRWVMGEQSARKLRGSQMQDVIFNGSEGHGPVGMAEVTVTFENDGVGVPIEFADYHEITVTRRLYRNGESEYLINRQPVRLRDVTDLFLGTGVGARAYAIVEQDRISLIVNAKPEERRRVVEEAAGVTKYKARRAAAERKLEATEHNLARVSDVVQELGKRLESLRRQARKTARYKKLRAEAERIELQSLSLRYLEHQALARVERERCTELTDGSERVEVDLRCREADIETGRIALLDDDRRLAAAQGRLYELESQVQLAEQEISHGEATLEQIRARAVESARDRQQLQAEIDRLAVLRTDLEQHTDLIRNESGDVEQQLRVVMTRVEELTRCRHEMEQREAELRNQLLEQRTREAELRSTIDANRRRCQELRTEIDRLAGESAAAADAIRAIDDEAAARRASYEQLQAVRDQTSVEVEQARMERNAAQERLLAADLSLQRWRERLGERRSRLASLQELDRTHAAAPAGVQQAFATAYELGLPGVGGLVAELLLVPAPYEAAVAALLGPSLQSILVDDLETAAALAAALRERGVGRVRFLPRRDVTPPAEPEGDPAALPARPLAALVETAPENRELVNRLFGGALLVDSVAQALELRRRRLRVPMVTPGGELVTADGCLAAGVEETAATGVLRQRREMRELEAELVELTQRVERAQRQHLEAAAQANAEQQRAERCAAELHQCELRLVEQEQQLRATADQQSRLRAQADAVTATAGRIDRQRQQAQREVERTTHELMTAQAAAAACSIEARAHAIESERIASQLALLVEQQTEVRVQAGLARERRESTERRLAEARAALADSEARLLRLEQSIERDQAEEIQRRAAIESARETAGLRARDASELRASLTSDRTSYEAAVERVSGLEGSARELRQQLARMRSELSTAMVDLNKHEMTLGHLVEDTFARFAVPLEHALFDFHLLPIPGPEATERLEQVRRIMDSMGDINLAAASEFEEIHTRHEFLSRQQDDLTHAVNQLHKAIAKIDRTTRQRFVEAFQAINEKFQQVFPRLFGGGQARLELLDPHDILNSGIEIYAQPPGKRLQAVSLMSGGEKALTAISLIFSVFLIKPSPFCLLDEVDAPLDEANIDRFTGLLKDISQISQFVFISHNRRTMEVAERLYGVTMETPGVSKIVSVQLTANGVSPTVQLSA
ncbi:MAG: chromosome segregation protein SMC [Deltaproteobacteria bacterium]|nr:chromosome segregation protein SMC [Deltaproteobacteria bacterium]